MSKEDEEKKKKRFYKIGQRSMLMDLMSISFTQFQSVGTIIVAMYPQTNVLQFLDNFFKF